jgi:hypothetical protein
MVGENINGIIDEVTISITYQSKWTTKLGEDELLYEFCNDRHCIVVQHLCFHPFGDIVYCY